MDNYLIILLLIIIVGIAVIIYLLLKNKGYFLSTIHDTSGDLVEQISRRQKLASGQELNVPADGKWHHIFSDMTGSTVLEIIATANGKEGQGKYCVLIAQAVNVFGRGEIRITEAYYGKSWNKLALKWKRNGFRYDLQIRTMSNFGNDSHIQVFVSLLYQSETASNSKSVDN